MMTHAHKRGQRDQGISRGSPSAGGGSPGRREGGPLVICPDARMAADLVALLAEGWHGAAPTVLGSYSSADVLAQTVNRLGVPLCFLDASSNREAASRLLAELSVLAPGVAVVSVLATNDPDLILRCLRQGASEFLIQPFNPAQLEVVLERLARNPNPAAEHNWSRVYCVTSAQGCSSAATLACNLAFHLGRVGHDKVLLADLDPLTGTLAFSLRLTSAYSFLDALKRASSLDADLWKAVVTSCQGLDVLLSPEQPVDALAELADPSPLLRHFRRSYQSTVLYAGGVYGDWNLALADQSDEVLLVTTGELPALHATHRALTYLRANGIPLVNIRLIVDRLRPDAGLPKDQIGTTLQAEVFHVLPSDEGSIQKALLEGKPVAPGSKFAKSVAALWERLAEQDGFRKKSPPTGPGGSRKKLPLAGLLTALVR